MFLDCRPVQSRVVAVQGQYLRQCSSNSVVSVVQCSSSSVLYLEVHVHDGWRVDEGGGADDRCDAEVLVREESADVDAYTRVL
ncbi:hypothetical protein Taro_032747 [Colocasia esculenta]|uniref:Uncharacterized protein n=1 Tax=Colocasia esculenta TaxID=4460 RepID=A0A843VY55_COLES|nr:hypothetical protein [Colocasia esculenta]